MGVPIIIPTLNRIKHLKRCIDSLKRSKYAESSELYLSVDYPPSARYLAGYEEVCNYVKQIQGFAKVNIFYQRENLGPRENIDFLISMLPDKERAFIWTEDDNEFSPNFLEYINKGINLFENDSDIFCLNASGPWPDTSKTLDGTYLMRSWVSARGVGFWRDKYDIFRKSWRKEIEQFSKEEDYQKRILRADQHLFQYIAHCYSREIPAGLYKNGDLCEIDYTYTVYNILNDYKVVFPTVNMVRNWGYDGSGVNCGIKEQNPCEIQIDQNDHFTFIKGDNFVKCCEMESEIYEREGRIKSSSLLRAWIIIKAKGTLREENFNKLIAILKNHRHMLLKNRV